MAWKKSPKYKSKDYTIYSNSNIKYNTFRTAYYITVGYNGEHHWVSVVNSLKEIVNKRFKTYSEANTYAKKYMRLH